MKKNIQYQIGIRKEDITEDVVTIIVREDGSFESNTKIHPSKLTYSNDGVWDEAKQETCPLKVSSQKIAY